MATLRPALACPAVTGLRFIPSLLLISIFLVILYDKNGFAERRWYRAVFWLVGVLFLSVTAGIALRA
jgi:hypothetical protein